MTRKESEKVNVEITDKKTGEILTEEKDRGTPANRITYLNENSLRSTYGTP